MGFNADAYLRARKPWELVLGGRTYRAGWVSVEQVQAFLVAFQGEKKEGEDQVTPPSAEQRTAATQVFLRKVFPARVSYLWRDPVGQIMGLDEEARGAILADFFVWWKAQRSASSTNGTDSPSRTPPPTPETGPADPASA